MPNKNYLPQGSNSKDNWYPQLDHFDFICGQVMKENRLLRYVVIVSCLAFFLSIGITIYAVSMPETVPVLVTMNDFGETRYIGPVQRKNYQNYSVPEVAIAHEIKEFVELYYGLSTDIKVMQKNYNKVFHFLTPTTAQKFNQLVKETNIYNDFGSKTREVVFETEPLLLSKDSSQVDFQIISRTLEGNVLKREYMRIVASIGLLDPPQEDIKDNPLGIYIISFDIKILENKKE